MRNLHGGTLAKLVASPAIFQASGARAPLGYSAPRWGSYLYAPLSAFCGFMFSADTNVRESIRTS